ncbi:DUF4254 domain-containing protein [Nocardia nova]|uniref:DUF4254 domain-containing protein n=1 Tax=Nocardia nova TaxID=37330 RepID=UPI0011DD2A1B|nr:DUF4254 domain-containing protein [Nocardia nova]
MPWVVREPESGQLPTAVQLLSVFQGNRFRDHELYRSAWAFVLLHRSRIETADSALVAEIDQRRLELIEEINEWSAQVHPLAHITLRIGALGTAVDRLARAWVEANHGLANVDAGTSASRRRWLRLAELVGGYNDLVQQSLGAARQWPTLAS